MAKSLIGKKFSYLTVIGYKPKPYAISWQCVCECGKKVWRAGWRLLNGKEKSCGCKHDEFCGNGSRKHGLRGTAEYAAWCGIKYRCYKPKCSQYKNYGGRGIKVCKRWLHEPNGFKNFIADMGHKPSKKHTLERVKNNGNYTPANCIWATMKEQSRNRRSTVTVIYRGKRISLSELAEKFGLKFRAFANYSACAMCDEL